MGQALADGKSGSEGGPDPGGRINIAVLVASLEGIVNSAPPAARLSDQIDVRMADFIRFECSFDNFCKNDLALIMGCVTISHTTKIIL